MMMASLGNIRENRFACPNNDVKKRRRYAARRAANVETTRNSSDEPRVSCFDMTIRRPNMIKSTIDHVRNMTGEDTELECRLLSSLVNHHSMVTARKASSVLSEKEQRCAEMLLGNLAKGLATVKGTHSKDDVIAKKCTLRMCSSKTLVESRMARVSGRVLNLNPKNFRTFASGRDEVLNEEGDQIDKWAVVKPGRKARCDKLLLELKELIVNWWIQRTRVSPIAKHVLKHEDHAIHTLDISQIMIANPWM
ncbi:hypothetical protein R1flu_015201 [Riccia fluitans]|uniref:Uncharacterized protein n=1 Tax=Riccia fluitans TaxID=41844 RepID=A0ABD1YIL4_9MARC